MALIHRDGRPYVYKSVRRDGRVTSEYVASGEAAALIARMEAIEREERDYERWEEAERHKEWSDVEREIDDLCEQAKTLAESALTAAGYQRHHRGEWRKRRVDRRREGEGE